MLTSPIQHFRWEFLRRNPRYRKDYSTLVNTLGKNPDQFFRESHQAWLALYVHPASKVETLFPDMDLKRVKEGFYELARFKEKWLLARPLDPESPLPDDMVLGEGSHRKLVEILSPVPQKDDENALGAEAIDLRINLSGSRKDILSHVEDLLSVYQRLYAESHFAEIREPKWAHMNEALRLYDAVTLGKQSFEQAVQMIWPDQEQESLMERAKHMLEEARELVELGPESWGQGLL